VTAEPLAAPTPLRRIVAEHVTRHRALASVAVLLILPLIAPYEALAVNILIYGLYAVGFNIVFGYTGLLSFGHAAFFGAGAYGCGIAIAVYGISWFPGLLIGMGLAASFAAVIGALAVRTRGIYFAMVTLALSQCVYYVFFQTESLTGGENGLRGVEVPTASMLGIGIDLIDPTVKYYFLLLFVAIALWVLARLLASPFGAALEAIRENETRAEACGYDVKRTKWLAFTVSSVFCGLAGGLSALHLSIVPIETLHYHTSGLAVMMALLGGMGTFFGPFVGAAVMLLIEDLVSAVTVHWQIFVGAVFILFVLFFPRGIWGTLAERFGR